MEFIVGLPDIAKNFVDLLTSMLRASDDVVGNVLETDACGVKARSKSHRRNQKHRCP